MSEKILARRESSVNDRKVTDSSKKRSMAQRRWRILARALTGSSELITTDPEDEISVRRFTNFNLLKIVYLENTPSDPESSWYEYSAMLENELFDVQIRRINKNFTANELIGFNNTGNVCVWPSEECLAYYLLKNREICRNKRVLELGGGMSCLAGMMAAKYCNPSAVTLTDGNVTSVDNVRCIVARNDMADFVKCGVVQWARAAKALRQQQETNGNRIKIWTSEEVSPLYDVILSADCLFFDEARQDLVDTIHGWLAGDGVALVMAPRRGTTFQRFAEAAVHRGFIARQIERYDNEVWSKHVQMLQTEEYREDLHYPVLMELRKKTG